MNRCKNLRKLRTSFIARIERLERRLSVSAGLAPHQQDPVVAYVTIETLNAWAQFSKAFYLSCVINAATESRVKISVTPQGMSTNDAIGTAIVRFKKYATPNSLGEWARRDEPAWHDPNVLLEVCRTVNCSLYGQIQPPFLWGSAFLLTCRCSETSTVTEIVRVRRVAQRIAPLYLVPTALRPSEILLRKKPAASASLLLEWMAELKITSEFICC